MKTVLRGIRYRLEMTRTIAARLLAFLQKEYHLK